MGCVPVVWSRARDLSSGRIPGSSARCVFVGALEVRACGGAPVAKDLRNKALSGGSLICCAALLLLLPLAGRGGEEEEKSGWAASRPGIRQGSLASVVLRRSTAWLLLVCADLLPWWTKTAVPAADPFLLKRLRLWSYSLDAISIDLAGRSGEGDGAEGVGVCGFLLPNRASSSAALIAAGIFGRMGPVSRRDGECSTSRREAFQGSSAGVPHRLLAKWSVPDGKTLLLPEYAALLEGQQVEPIA